MMVLSVMKSHISAVHQRQMMMAKVQTTKTIAGVHLVPTSHFVHNCHVCGRPLLAPQMVLEVPATVAPNMLPLPPVAAPSTQPPPPPPQAPVMNIPPPAAYSQPQNGYYAPNYPMFYYTFVSAPPGMTGFRLMVTKPVGNRDDGTYGVLDEIHPHQDFKIYNYYVNNVTYFDVPEEWVQTPIPTMVP